MTLLLVKRFTTSAFTRPNHQPPFTFPLSCADVSAEITISVYWIEFIGWHEKQKSHKHKNKIALPQVECSSYTKVKWLSLFRDRQRKYRLLGLLALREKENICWVVLWLFQSGLEVAQMYWKHFTRKCSRLDHASMRAPMRGKNPDRYSKNQQ